VVDDETALADAVAKGLKRDGYAVDVAYGGLEALEKAESADYDLICLDRTMGDLDGIEVCGRLKSQHGSSVRVLMLTALDTVGDRVDGLDAGADDYLVKPFAFPELLARVRTLLRRDSDQTDATLRVGDIELDVARHEARRGERDLGLTSKEFALLRYFVHRVGEVLSQEHLLEHVWDANADPFTNTVRVTVGTLRRKLVAGGEASPIETLKGVGYRMVDPDAEVTPDQGPSE